MKKSELVDKIKSIVKDINSNKMDIPEKGDTLPMSRFDLVNEFPELKDILVHLMTADFEQFLKNVYWVAPKPTTFKIILINNQHFFLMYGKRSWEAKIEGKKYYLSETKDNKLASESISRILHYGEISDKSISNSDKKDKEEVPETEAPEAETEEK